MKVRSLLQVLWGLWVCAVTLLFLVAEIRLRRSQAQQGVCQQETGHEKAEGDDAAWYQLVNCTVHVRDIGNVANTERKLQQLLQRFGKVSQATIRERKDATTGADTSWALVTMENQTQRDEILANAGDTGMLALSVRSKSAKGKTVEVEHVVRVTKFDARVADKSSGQMGTTAREAELKLLMKVPKAGLGKIQSGAVQVHPWSALADKLLVEQLRRQLVEQKAEIRRLRDGVVLPSGNP